MVGLLPVAALLLVAAAIDVDATVVAESRGGEAPLQAGGPSRGGFVGVLTPGGELELRRPDATLRLDYGARVFWRQPNESGACPTAVACQSEDRSSRLKPLVLHGATLAATLRASQRLTLSGGAATSVGEADYSTLPQLVAATGGATQATLPSVIEIFSVSARAGAVFAATRIWSLGAAVDVSHRRPLGSEGTADPANPDASLVILPRQTALRFEPTAVARLSRQDDLLLLSPISYQTYSRSSLAVAGTTFLIITPEVGWRTHLSRQYDLRLVGGVAYVHSVGTLSGRPAPTPFGPVGNVELQGRVYQHQGIATQLTLGATVEYYVDPILVVAVPRGTASARFSVLFAPDWTATLEALFGTNLSGQPLDAGTTAPLLTITPDETAASVTLPIRHRASDNLIVEFGGRWSDRGPHLSASNFAFHQRELWAYVMLTATTRHLPRWTAP